MTNIEHLGKYDSSFSFRKIFVWFILIVLVVSLTALYFTLSKATIVLIPKVETKEIQMQVTLDSNQTGINYDTQTIRGVIIANEISRNKVQNKILEKRIEENAVGKVVVHNGYTKAIGFKAGEVLIDKNDPTKQRKVTFKENVTIYRNQTKTVEVLAQEKGPNGQLDPTEFIVEKYNDYMNEKVSVKSEEKFIGGIKVTDLILESDVDILKTELYKELIEENFEKLKNKTREGEYLDKSLLTNEVSDYFVNVTPPVEGESFEVSMKVKSLAPVFQESDLRALVDKRFKDEALSDQEYINFDLENWEITIDVLDLQKNIVVLNIGVQGRYKPKLSTKLFNRDEIKGYNESALKNYYDDFDDLESFKVQFWPNFRTTVPEMDSQIIIKVEDK